MGDKSNIEWTDATWTPIRARVKEDAAQIAAVKYPSLVQIAGAMAGHAGPHCERHSPGCLHCYSETNNSRCLPNNGTGLPFDRRARDLVDMFLDERILNEPLRWKSPRLIFVCSQTDLFGEFVPEEMLYEILAVVYECQWHTFQALTKRAGLMRERMSSIDLRRLASVILMRAIRRKASYKGLLFYSDIARDLKASWPLKNLWLGVSVENQKYADERIPLLLQTPAAMRWLSIEPLLGPVDLKPRPKHERCLMHHPHDGECITRGLDWVVVGGESGPGARPMHPDWARSLRDQCQFAGVPFFFKQWGESVPVAQGDCNHPYSGAEGPVSQLVPAGRVPQIWKCGVCGKLHGYQGVRVDETTGISKPFDFNRVGKKKSGAKLDGIEHRGYPAQTFAGECP